MTTYIVFGPGWGSQWVGVPGEARGSGDIAYTGPSIDRARKVRDQRNREARQIPNASANYYVLADYPDRPGYVRID